jgi:hypothetical protein
MKNVKISEPVLICYRMLRQCRKEGAQELIFFDNRIERRTLEGRKTGELKTPKPFAEYMRHILENDSLVADSVERIQEELLKGLQITLKTPDGLQE